MNNIRERAKEVVNEDVVFVWKTKILSASYQ